MTDKAVSMEFLEQQVIELGNMIAEQRVRIDELDRLCRGDDIPSAEWEIDMVPTVPLKLELVAVPYVFQMTRDDLLWHQSRGTLEGVRNDHRTDQELKLKRLQELLSTPGAKLLDAYDAREETGICRHYLVGLPTLEEPVEVFDMSHLVTPDERQQAGGAS